MSGVGTSVAKLVSSSRFFFFFSVRSPVRVESLLQAVAATRRGMREGENKGVRQVSGPSRDRAPSCGEARATLARILHISRRVSDSVVCSVYENDKESNRTPLKSSIHERLVRAGIEKFDCQIARPKRI
eukprot:31265-Pelagococcus_subviridis.AAC.13